MHTLIFTSAHEDAQIPSRTHVTDAGLDLAICEQRTISSGQTTLVNTGLSVAIPQGHYGNLTPRSSTVFRHGLLVVPGVIDAGFTGEIQIAVVNLSESVCWLPVGTKIAQLILVPIVPTTPQMTYRKLLRRTTRGTDGFGSTG